MYSKCSRLLCVTLAISLVVTLFWTPVVDASTSRVANVDEVVGNVYVKKEGGNREHRAYTGMSLSKGDHIRTGSGSSVVLRLADRNDRISLSANTEMYISDLTDDGEKRSTGLRMWAGNVYSKVTSLFGSADVVEIDTPTASMGVRGTHFMAGINPESGDTFINTFSGIVEGQHFDRNELSANGENDENGNNRTAFEIYPGQEGYVFGNDDQTGSSAHIVQVDLHRLTQVLGEDMIRDLLEDQEDIRDENRELSDVITEGLRNQGFLAVDTDSGEVRDDERERLERNLDNLVSNVVRTAIETNRITRERADEIVQQINERRPDRPIDLDEEVEPLESLQGERVTQAEEELLRRQEERQRQLEEERNRREERAEQERELLEQLRERQEQLNRENEAAEEERQRQAEERYLERLEEAERERYEQARAERERERERARQEAEMRQERERQAEERRAEQEEQEEEQSSGSSGPSAVIESIHPVMQTVDVGESYSLPNQVSATMSNGSTRDVSVNWEDSAVDTTFPGRYSFTGSVSGYSDEVHLMLTVVGQYGVPVPVKSGAPMIFEGEVTLIFHEDLPDHASLIVTELEASEVSSSEMSPAGKILDFEMLGMDVEQPVTLTIPVDEDFEGNSNQLGVFYNESDAVWSYQDTWIEEDGYAQATIYHFSTYGLFEAERSNTPEALLPPGLASVGDTISFAREPGTDIYYLDDASEHWELYGEHSNLRVSENGWSGNAYAVEPNHVPSDVLELNYVTAVARPYIEAGTHFIELTFSDTVEAMQFQSGETEVVVPELTIDGDTYVLGVWYADLLEDGQYFGMAIEDATISGFGDRVILTMSDFFSPDQYLVRFFDQYDVSFSGLRAETNVIDFTIHTPSISLRTDALIGVDERVELEPGEAWDVQVYMNNVENLAGLQLHLLYEGIDFVDGSLRSDFGPDVQPIEHSRQESGGGYDYPSSEGYYDGKELLYVMIIDEHLNTVDINPETKVLDITFEAEEPYEASFEGELKLAEVIAVDSNGDKIRLDKFDYLIPFKISGAEAH